MGNQSLNQWEIKSGEVVSIKEQCKAIIQEIETLRNSQDKVIGIRTGFKQLDTLLSGLQKGNLVLLTGRPGVGKTGFALNIVDNLCKDNYGVMYFSLDLSAKQLMKRFMASSSGMSISSINTGNLNNDEFKKVNDVSSELADKDFFVYENTTIIIDELRNKCLRLKECGKLDLIVIDYLQCISVESEKLIKDPLYLYAREDWVNLSNSLKLLARKLNVPIIALANIERVDEDLDTQIFFNSTGLTILEQNVDVILLMSPDNLNDDFKYTNLIIAKNKNGNLGTIKYKYDDSKSRFYEE